MHRRHDITLMSADDPKLPIHLLIFAMQAGITTLTCIADYMSWTMITSAQKANLHQLYVPYLCLGALAMIARFEANDILAAVMGLDMYGRLSKSVGTRATASKKRS